MSTRAVLAESPSSSSLALSSWRMFVLVRSAQIHQPQVVLEPGWEEEDSEGGHQIINSCLIQIKTETFSVVKKLLWMSQKTTDWTRSYPID